MSPKHKMNVSRMVRAAERADKVSNGTHDTDMGEHKERRCLCKTLENLNFSLDFLGCTFACKVLFSPEYILVCHVHSSFPSIGRGTDGANAVSVRISARWMKDGMQTLRVQTSVVVRMVKKEVITLTCSILFPNLL